MVTAAFDGLSETSFVRRWLEKTVTDATSSQQTCASPWDHTSAILVSVTGVRICLRESMAIRTAVQVFLPMTLPRPPWTFAWFGKSTSKPTAPGKRPSKRGRSSSRARYVGHHPSMYGHTQREDAQDRFAGGT
jgi:hypothetical protein